MVVDDCIAMNMTPLVIWPIFTHGCIPFLLSKMKYHFKLRKILACDQEQTFQIGTLGFFAYIEQPQFQLHVRLTVHRAHS